MYRRMAACAGVVLAAGFGAYGDQQTFTFQQGVNSYTGFDDTSIFSESTNSGGGTNGIFAGRNNNGDVRRALLRADLGDIPAGSTIVSVTLDLSVNNAPNTNTPNTYELHALTADWGEGTVVGAMGGGQGGAANPGDATWTSNVNGTSTWTTAGGDYNATVSASATSGASGTVTSWIDGGLIADVQGWIDTPASNFGWIIIGPETTNQRLRRFDSAEATSLNPLLTIVADVPDPLPASNTPAMIATGLALLVAAWFMRRAFRRAH